MHRSLASNEEVHERACNRLKTSEQRNKKVVIVANAISAERHNTEINK